MKYIHRILPIGKSSLSGRVYPKEELDKVVESFKESTKPLFAVLDNTGFLRQGYIDLESIAGKVEHLELDDEGLIVYIEVLQTPQGIILQDLLNHYEVINDTLIEEGIDSISPLRVSPIFTGKLKSENGESVTYDMQLHGVQYQPVANEKKNDK